MPAWLSDRRRYFGFPARTGPLTDREDRLVVHEIAGRAGKIRASSREGSENSGKRDKYITARRRARAPWIMSVKVLTEIDLVTQIAQKGQRRMRRCRFIILYYEQWVTCLRTAYRCVWRTIGFNGQQIRLWRPGRRADASTRHGVDGRIAESVATLFRKGRLGV